MEGSDARGRGVKVVRSERDEKVKLLGFVIRLGVRDKKRGIMGDTKVLGPNTW